jgi:hypothetical protein
MAVEIRFKDLNGDPWIVRSSEDCYRVGRLYKGVDAKGNPTEKGDWKGYFMKPEEVLEWLSYRLPMASDAKTWGELREAMDKTRELIKGLFDKEVRDG